MRKLALVISTILFAGSALAVSSVATLNVDSGSVLVNQGKQFVTAQPGQILAAGDRVMVMEGGNASVKYADGCVQTLGSGSLAVVDAQSVCASGINKIAQISPVSAQVLGDQESDCDGDNIVDSQDPNIDGDDEANDVDSDDYTNCKKAGYMKNSNTGIWVAAGATAIAAAVLISNGDDETISP